LGMVAGRGRHGRAWWLWGEGQGKVSTCTQQGLGCSGRAARCPRLCIASICLASFKCPPLQEKMGKPLTARLRSHTHTQRHTHQCTIKPHSHTCSHIHTHQCTVNLHTHRHTHQYTINTHLYRRTHTPIYTHTLINTCTPQHAQAHTR